MLVNYAQLNRALPPPFKACTVISGDEPLLVQLARDAVIKAAQDHGYSQRKRITVTTANDWTTVMGELASQDLFSDKSIVDVRSQQAKFAKAQSGLIKNYLEHANPDKLLIITLPKLTAAQRKTQWFKQFDQRGNIVQIWPIKGRDLLQWIRQQLAEQQLTADTDSIRLLATFTEGNLLATHQAISKLKLLYPNNPIDEKAMLEVVTDANRYHVFDLSEALLAGHLKKTLRILRCLQQTGTEPTLVLWAIARECRQLYNLQFNARHQSLNSLLAKEWKSRQALLRQALQRCELKQISHWIHCAQQADLCIKGLNHTPPWTALTQLCTAICQPNHQPYPCHDES